MPTNTLKTLLSYQKKIAALQRDLEKQRRKLLALPAKHGFPSMRAFIDALSEASGSARAVPEAPKRRRKRTAITDQIRAMVKELLAAKKTAGEISRSVGISVPSVYNIKKSLRQGKTPKKSARKGAKKQPAAKPSADVLASADTKSS